MLIYYLQALSTRSLAARTGQIAERGPTVLFAPCDGLVGVPRGAVRASRSQVPPHPLWVIVMVRGLHVRTTLTNSAVNALTLTGKVRTAMPNGEPTETQHAAALVVGTQLTFRLQPALLGGSAGRQV